MINFRVVVALVSGEDLTVLGRGTKRTKSGNEDYLFHMLLGNREMICHFRVSNL